MSLLAATISGRVFALQDIDVSLMFIGQQIAELTTGELYKLCRSTDTVDHDAVEAVKENENLRWIKQRVDTSTSTTKVLPATDGNVQLGADGALADSALTGFPTIPMVAATFDKGAAAIDEGHVAVTYRETTNQIGIYVPGTGWLWTSALTADS